MKRSNWRLSAILWFKRLGMAALLAAAGLTAANGPQVARADVVAEGDYSPSGGLPINGGTVEGDITVGGTGDSPIFSVGRMSIDVPAFTIPLVSTNGFIGFSPDGIGEVSVAGFLSEWTIKELLSVGVEGQAYLTISGGAIVRTNFDGTVSTDTDGVVGEMLGSQGFVSVTGVGSKLINTDLTVGLRGKGDISVLAGARLITLNEAILGDESRLTSGTLAVGSGLVTVSGTGSRWTVADQLTVGREGRGEVHVFEGGLVHVEEDITFGALNTASATIPAVYAKAIVSGQDSMIWAEETITVSAPLTNAQAEVYVEDRGMLRADTDIIVGEQGFINLNGGTLLTPVITSAGVIRGAGTINGAIVNNGDIRNTASTTNPNVRERLLFTGVVTNNDNIESVGGEMEFKGNVTNNTPDGDIYGKDAIFRFLGVNGLVNNSRVTLDNTIVESTVFTNNAALAVQADATSTIIGNLSLSSTSILEMDLGDDYSKLWVTGTADLGGILSLSLTPNYVPQLGDSFEILRSDTLAGSTFDAVISPGTMWNVTYPGDSVFVTYAGIAAPGIGADFNGDNIVDGADLAVWKQNYGVGTNPPPLATQQQGDANGDGKVDGADLLILQRQYGGPPSAMPSVGGSIVGVPEPSALVLAAAAFGLPLAARRRRK
jgi:T5SS/PEP-CTERM-associated repeat protein